MMIKYKIEGNNADEFRKMIMGVDVEKQDKKDNGKCPICGGSEFDINMMTSNHNSYDGNMYSYQGKMCLKCNYVKPNKL